MDNVLLWVALVVALGMTLGLFRVIAKTEGVHIATCVLFGSCMGVTTLLLLGYITRICR
jgi:hypothetical protein